MKRIITHIMNYVWYLIGCGVLGRLWGVLFGYLFRGFLTDEAYAAEHPKKFLLGVIGIMLATYLSAMAFIWYPLTKIMKWLDSKIEDYADEKEWD